MRESTATLLVQHTQNRGGAEGVDVRAGGGRYRGVGVGATLCIADCPFYTYIVGKNSAVQNVSSEVTAAFTKHASHARD